MCESALSVLSSYAAPMPLIHFHMPTVAPLDAAIPRHIVSSRIKNKGIVTSYVEIIWLVKLSSGMYLSYAK